MRYLAILLLYEVIRLPLLIIEYYAVSASRLPGFDFILSFLGEVQVLDLLYLTRPSAPPSTRPMGRN